MTLKLYNTRTRQKEIFEPLDPGSVRMYVCGPTVYDFAHIGNARPLIVFDVLFRLLRHLYGPDHVKYVRNITDVDDKINARAAQEGISIRELTERTAAQFHADAAAIGCLPPSIEPRATEHIVEMISLIERLIKRDHAYAAEGHVLFDVASDPDYGSLAKRSVDEMRAGARVEVAPYKRDPMDFVLWKPSTGNEPGWESPWGFGRPGWHLECSAMSEKHLGEVFDIHGGGIDLVFPHHENEVAQSTCAHGTKIMANVWMHNGHLQVEGQKMSKSLGNFITIRDLSLKWPGDALRHNMLKTHYREPIDWTKEGLLHSMQELLSWSQHISDFFDEPKEVETIRGNVDASILYALHDDLNTPEMLSRLRLQFQKSKEGTTNIEDFVETLRFLGFRQFHKSGFFHPGFIANLYDSGPKIEQGSETENEVLTYRAATANSIPVASTTIMTANVMTEVAKSTMSSLREKGFSIALDDLGVLRVANNTSADTEELKRSSDERIKQMIEKRNAARKAKNWAEADRIRNELAAMGIALKDAKNPATGEIETTWEVAR
jgi:cysteinyl-tRNA synthetase